MHTDGCDCFGNCRAPCQAKLQRLQTSTLKITYHLHLVFVFFPKVIELASDVDIVTRVRISSSLFEERAAYTHLQCRDRSVLVAYHNAPGVHKCEDKEARNCTPGTGWEKEKDSKIVCVATVVPLIIAL